MISKDHSHFVASSPPFHKSDSLITVLAIAKLLHAGAHQRNPLPYHG